MASGCFHHHHTTVVRAVLPQVRLQRMVRKVLQVDVDGAVDIAAGYGILRALIIHRHPSATAQATFQAMPGDTLEPLVESTFEPDHGTILQHIADRA